MWNACKTEIRTARASEKNRWEVFLTLVEVLGSFACKTVVKHKSHALARRPYGGFVVVVVVVVVGKSLSLARGGPRH